MPDWLNEIRNAYDLTRRRFGSHDIALYMSEDYFLDLRAKSDFSKHFDVSDNRITLSSVKVHLVKGKHPNYRFVVY